MKLPNLKIYLLLATLTVAVGAFAQSNGVPVATDFARFSQFVADRNIFDPNRQPHTYSTTYRPRPRVRTRVTGTPGIMLVGTMSYEKGMFAFFNGNNADLKKALQTGEKIAGYTVANISPSRVTLQSADKKQRLELKIGDGLRQENGKWVPSNAAELLIEPGSAEGTNASSEENSTPTPAAPASPGEPNDILKRLMQLREKENQ